jgi:ABC-type multidrug transport system permease subunit
MNRGGAVRSHKLKFTVPAALVLAGLFVLTLGLAAAQAAPLIRGRYATHRALATSSGGVSVGFALVSAASVAVVAGVIYYAVAADRRPIAPTAAATEPATLRADKSKDEQERKAA